MAWTLTYQALPGGTPVEHTFVWWGLSEPRLSKRHASGDEARFAVVDDDAFAAAPLLDVGATGLEHRVWITQDGVIRFVGYITESPMTSDGRSERKEFVLKGVGHLLTRIIYKQVRQAGFYPTYALEPVTDAHVWLGQSEDGTYINNGEVMGEILAYAAGKAGDLGHDFQHDATGFPEVPLLLDEQTGITCEQAFVKMLAHSPDSVAWWDYSTTAAGLPKPTFCCKARAALAVVTKGITEGHLTVSPRYDLLTRSVAINYESTRQVDNASVPTLGQDIYPTTLDGSPVTGDELGVLSVTVPLQGSKSQTLSGTLVCSTIQAASATDGLRVSWWLAQHQDLRRTANAVQALFYDGAGQATVPVVAGQVYFFDKGNATSMDWSHGTLSASGHFTNATIAVTLYGPPLAEVTSFVGRVSVDVATVRRSGSHAYARRLDPGSGGLAPWMGFSSEEETITAQAFVVDDTGGHYQTLSVQLTATNATSGSYATNATLSEGEPQPVGLAQKYYEALSVLHWQGQFTLVELDPSWSVDLGQVLNVTDGLPALATGKLMIWAVDVDVFNGTTTVQFGDPQNVGIGDLVDRLRALRFRRLETAGSVQTTGVAGSGAGVLPTVNPVSVNGQSVAARVSSLLAHPDPTGSGVTQQVKNRLEDLPAGKVAQWREFSICVGGVTKTAWFLATEPA